MKKSIRNAMSRKQGAKIDLEDEKYKLSSTIYEQVGKTTKCCLKAQVRRSKSLRCSKKKKMREAWKKQEEKIREKKKQDYERKKDTTNYTCKDVDEFIELSLKYQKKCKFTDIKCLKLGNTEAYPNSVLREISCYKEFVSKMKKSIEYAKARIEITEKCYGNKWDGGHRKQIVQAFSQYVQCREEYKKCLKHRETKPSNEPTKKNIPAFPTFPWTWKTPSRWRLLLDGKKKK